MAPPQRNHRPSPLEVPPSASSSEVEVTGSGSGSGSEQPNITVVVTPQKNTKPQKPHAKKPEPSASSKPPRSSSPPSSGESETEPGSDTATTVHDVKPRASKPMQDSHNKPMQQEPPKTRSKSAASPAKPAKSGTKRAPAGGDVEVSKASKKAKKDVKKVKEAEENNKVKAKEAQEETVEENEDVKNKGKPLFQRLWGDEDEINLVKGMLEYAKVKGGADPVADVESFYDFVAPLLSMSVSKNQVYDKTRRMKKKYENIACNKFKPTQDHDWEAYKLMKMVWGGGGDEARKVEESKEDQNGSRKAKAVAPSEPLKEPSGSAGVGVGEVNGGGGIVKVRNPGGGFVKGLNEGGVTVKDLNEGGGTVKDLNEGGGIVKGLNELGGWENFVNQGMKLVDEAKTREVKGKLKEVHLLELELFIKKTQVMGDQAKLILEALKSSDN